jgi:peptidoglycan L-alanyl-D-glutamate endopeptidase CwlK
MATMKSAAASSPLRRSPRSLTPTSSALPAPAASPAPTVRDVDPARLHPSFRQRLANVIERLQSEGIPFRVFEAWRSPQRQKYLWEQGRTRPGGIVTKAQAWESYHQYGLAADLVLFEDGKWSWNTDGQRAAWWKRLHELGRDAGLEPLSFELPHLQIAGITLGALKTGSYPPGGDDTWAENLTSAIYSWQGTPAAPPGPPQLDERPPLALTAAVPASSAPPVLPVTGSEDWHGRFGGQEWRHDGRGVYLRGTEGGNRPLRTDGEPKTMRRIWQLFGEQITAASVQHGVPPALIMMAIATETAAYRNYGFSGPMTFRWEPHVRVTDVAPALFGDYSAGPMQILATTARWVIGAQHLDYDAFSVAPVYERRPEPPQTHPMYQAAVNIDLGTAVIKQRWQHTGDDPILVAAAYNAGGVYESGDNAWGVRCYGNHLDRAAQWYGDACFVLSELAGSAPMPAPAVSGGDLPIERDPQRVPVSA